MKKLYIFLTTALSFLFIFLLISCGANNESSTNNGNTVTATTTTTTTTEAPTLLDSARSIKIVQIEGTATVKDEDGELRCFKGMNLYDGDTLNIGENSVLVVKFDDDKYIYLGENTKINIKSEGNDKYKTNVFVEKGIVLAEIQNKLGVEEEFFLSSNNSVMAVRGTVFGLEVKEINNELVEIYSVFKGVTELFAFDKINGELVKGKLSDISNKKIELKVNKNNIINNEEFNQITDNWLDDVDEKFDDPDDANSKMDEVEISVSTPSEDDYKKVVETVSEETKVNYTPLTYKSEGFFDNYDGNPHKISVVVDNLDAKVFYRSEDVTEYQETNDFEYTNPGTYRVYYKIVCDGYEDKEDFEVINIYKKNLDVALSSNITTKFYSGMTLEYAFKDINLFDYLEINGIAEKDIDSLAQSTFKFDGRLSDNQDTYNVGIELPDNLKAIYNNVSFEITLDVEKLSYYAPSLSISTNIDNLLILMNSMSFNKYNDINEDDVFNGIEFSSNEYLYPNNIVFEYENNIDGYIKLHDGENLFTAKLEFDDFDIIDEFSFIYHEYRQNANIRFRLGSNIAYLGGNDYFYDISNLQTDNINIGRLAEDFGIENSQVLVNYPKDIIDDTASLYGINGSLSFVRDEFVNVTFSIFPTDEYFYSEKSIRICFSESRPDGYPEYTINEDNLKYQYSQNGVTVNFIESEETVLYSLDGENYNANLVINDIGEYEVYYKVGNSLIVEGSSTVIVDVSKIISENLSMLSPNIYIISDDGNELYLAGEATGSAYTVTSTDGTVITPLSDLYTVYTNILKNSNYFDSITSEPLSDVNVLVSEKNEDNANFTYTISRTGYETIEGSVEFTYSSFGYVGSNFESITNPIDLTLLYDSEGYNVSRIITSFENNSQFYYSTIYSIDNGKTWVNGEINITEPGNYTVYCIYNLLCTGINGKNGSCTLSTNGNYIVSIQNITISE